MQPFRSLHIKSQHAVHKPAVRRRTQLPQGVLPRGTNGQRQPRKPPLNKPTASCRGESNHIGALEGGGERQTLPRRGRQPSACRAPPAYFLQAWQRPIRKKGCRQLFGELQGALEGPSWESTNDIRRAIQPTRLPSPPPLPQWRILFHTNEHKPRLLRVRQASGRNAGRRHYARTAVPDHPL